MSRSRPGNKSVDRFDAGIRQAIPRFSYSGKLTPFFVMGKPASNSTTCYTNDPNHHTYSQHGIEAAKEPTSVLRKIVLHTRGVLEQKHERGAKQCHHTSKSRVDSDTA